MDELKPCPFCGRPAEVWLDDSADQVRYHYWAAGCRTPKGMCKVEPQTYDSHKDKDGAIADWNRRVELAKDW